MAATTTTIASPFAQRSAFNLPPSQAKNISPHSTSPTSPHSATASTGITTPPQTSPTTPNPYLPLAPRQLHPPKCPMYRPAALRTTQRATIVSGGAKPELLDALAPVDKTPTGPPKAPDTIVMEPSVGSTEEVTGLPSKSNWKPDAEATVCDFPICNKTFSLFDRRHHCRRCGNIFCAQHASQYLKLDQHCRYNAKGFDSRVCRGCFDEYQRLRAKSRLSSSSGSDSSTQSVTAPQPAKQMMTTRYTNDGTLRGRLNSYVGSYRDNWSWSTF